MSSSIIFTDIYGMKTKCKGHPYYPFYFRLTPALAMVYFFQLTLARRMGSGPFYMQLFDQLNKPCYDNWWSLFLYVQNYVATDNMVWSWLLTVYLN